GAADVSPSSLRRLSVLGGDFGSLRLSRKEMLHMTQIRDNIGLPPHEAGYLFGWEIGRDIVLVTSAVSSATVPGHALVDVNRGATVEFPVSAADLLGEFRGPELGQKLKSLEKRWVDSNFTLSKSELLSQG
ncbi:MAG: CCA tRNA nucleotidyltransferase, partial [Pseudomonadota bacterium]